MQPGGRIRHVCRTATFACCCTGLVVEGPATLQAAGARLRNELVSGGSGMQILAEDPSGNPMELVEPQAAG